MAFLRNELGQLIRKDGSLVPRPVARRGPGKPRASHLRVDEILGGPGPLREEYERLLETPGTLLRHLQAWFAERGHRVNLSAIRRHRQKYQDEFRCVREAAAMAEAFCRITGKHGRGAFVDAASGRFEMLMTQKLFEMKNDPKMSPDEWQAWGKTLLNLSKNRKSVEDLRVDFERRAKEAAAELEQMDPKEKMQVVVERVREILGV